MSYRPSLTTRIFLVYVVSVALASWFVWRTVLEEIKPAVRQSTEETLVDTANLLAEIVQKDVRDGTLTQSSFARALHEYARRAPAASIWGLGKNSVNHRVYVTDGNGIVLLDSDGTATGKDFSRWNDVYLTLQGRYGARTTRTDPADERSTVMHVGAPIRDGEAIIGVVTVAKPNSTVQPYIDLARRRVLLLAGAMLLGGLAIGALMSWWLSATIRRLTRYADSVSAGQRAVMPQLPGDELGQLAQSLESMRTQLEGREYVERYVETLTHELKSPLAGIHATAELLRGELPAPQRQHFLDNIDVETGRLQDLVERLLNLAMVEQRRGLEERASIRMRALVDEVVASLSSRALDRVIVNEVHADAIVTGERFLLRQMLANLVGNALDFTPVGGRIVIGAGADGDWLTLVVRNEGEHIADFALSRLTERFFSMPRPATGHKSTGLGLNFVLEVAQLHGGSLEVVNVAGGVEARVRLPCD